MTHGTITLDLTDMKVLEKYGETPAPVTTEPSGSAYARQTDTVTTAQISGDFGFDNDAQLTFDTSDSTQPEQTKTSEVDWSTDEPERIPKGLGGCAIKEDDNSGDV